MAATGSHDDSPDADAGDLQARLHEEIGRAERTGGALSCLLVSVNTEALRDHSGENLPEHAVAYMADALRRQLRRFDRVGHLGLVSSGEMLVLLPGADGPRAEIVARRTLARLRAVKVEVDGRRESIRVQVSLGTWAAGLSANELLERTRLATGAGQRG
jgi:GGDEF domain-containing protein